AVFRPRRAGEFYPLDMIGQILAAADVPHFPFVPIRAGAGQTVSHKIAVVADRMAAYCHRAVGGELVWIEEDFGFTIQRLDSVEHALVLQSVVPAEEIAPALFERGAIALVIPKLR